MYPPRNLPESLLFESHETVRLPGNTITNNDAAPSSYEEQEQEQKERIKSDEITGMEYQERAECHETKTDRQQSTVEVDSGEKRGDEDIGKD